MGGNADMGPGEERMLRAPVVKVNIPCVGAARWLVALLVLAGCYWSRYPQLMETHLELLDQFGAKLEALEASGRGVPIESWAEFVYPLDRARDFARIAKQRFPDRESLQEFDNALARYADLVDDPTLLSRGDARARIGKGRADLSRAITDTRAALAREAGA